MFNIENEIKKLPDKPGVYIMHDENDNVIYVGKAVSLKNRVRQYFRKNNKTARIERMVSLIKYFEYIVTDTEAEALILECNLIKKYSPKFNVLLKDDKTYPYIKIDVQNEYPYVCTTRRILNDGAKYYGPYANAGAAKEMVNFIREKFYIRQCKNFKSNQRVCLNYHIKRCPGPCVNKISKNEYMKQIEQIQMLLEGKTKNIIKIIEDEIKIASEKLEFEKAAVLRDKRNAIQAISEKQKISNISENNIDVIGIFKNEMQVCIEIFFVRGSKLVGREHYFIENQTGLTDEEIVSSFIKQYYLGRLELPNKIMIKENIEEKEIIEQLLTDIAKRKVEIKIPQKGEKLKFVEMAIKNAQITLENQIKDKFNVLNELKETLRLDKLPIKIESFDISNISGTNMVAGMVVAKNGEINKNMSRRFKIKTVFGQDDPKCMNEVVSRRIKQSLENPKGGFGTLPDLILVDGGITQIRAVKKAVKENNVDISVFGMIKDDKHRTKALIDDVRIEYNISEELMKFITNLQDDVHKVAIEYHQKLRDKEMLKSELDNIDGVGEVKRKELLRTFGTIENIKKANLQELIKVKGINENIAKKIKEQL